MKYFSVLLAMAFLLDGIAEEKLLFRCDFSRNDGGWRIPAYWGGRLEWKGGMLHMTATKHRNQVWGRTFADCTADSISGGIFRLKMRIRGMGKAVAGFLLYPERGKAPQIVSSDQTVKLGGSWQDVEFQLDLSEKAMARLAPFIELRGEGNLQMDDVTIARISPNKAGMKLLSSVPVIRRGDPFPELKLSTNLKSTWFFVFSGRKVSRITSSPEGVLVIPGSAVEEESDTPPSVIAGHGGDTLRLTFNVIDADLYERFEKAAAKMKLKEPLEILYLGDSLLDFDRGTNAADILNYWLNRGNPGKASFHNFSVRGDSLRRVMTRLQGNPVYRAGAYDGMLKLKPDLVFLWLGQNDTASRSNDDFRTSAISSEEQKKLTSQLMSRLKSAWPAARFVFVSPSSSDSELQHAKAIRQVKSGQKNVVRFGDPEKIEAFDRTWCESAKKAGAMYIDIYNPLKNLPDKKKLFKTGDGVHFNPAGCNLVALLWLEALGREQ